MKRIASLLFLLTCLSIQVFAQTGTITGKITDEKKEPIIGAVIRVIEGGHQKGSGQTDIDGIYTIKPLNPGRYDVVVSYIGYKEKKITGVIVSPDKNTIINAQMDVSSKLNEVVVTSYRVPLIDKYSPGSTKTITSEQIEKLPTRNVDAVAATVSRKNRRSEDLNISGARASESLYIIDGIQVRGSGERKYKDNTYNAKPTMIKAMPVNESYKKDPENDFMTVKANPLSTMSVDVDRASYANVRRFINEGQIPPPDAVRIEEMINYFEYNYPQPTDDKPLSINTELTDCPWQKEHKLLHIGMQAITVNTEDLPPSNLVFLVDVSGSMGTYNKLPLVKSALKMLTTQLRPQDKISIVVYAGSAGLVLPATYGSQKKTIYNALDRLEAGGSTAGGAGIKLAYNVAMENYIRGGNNRVILATDGDFNVGVSGDNELEELIVKERQKGIALTCLGFGMGNYKDSKMEVLADKGNGNYSYIDNAEEAEKTLVKEFGGTIFTVAKDVKAQIEFNPEYVQAYRLVGYENRLLNEEDFKDDKKDAGDMGSGHTVTIIYEIIPTGTSSKLVRGTTPLKYQQQRNYPSVLDHVNQGEFATIKFRYKQPNGNTSKEMTHIITDETTDLQNASEDSRFSTSVAMFGMLLKNSEYKGSSNYNKVLALAKSSMSHDNEGYRAEFIQLVKKVNRNEVVSWNEED